MARFIHFRASSQSSMHRYHSQNTMGSPMYPPGTNHFNPNSPLFKSEQRTSLYFTDITRLSNLFLFERHLNHPFQSRCEYHGMLPLLYGAGFFFVVLFDSICGELCYLCLREDFVNWLILGRLPSSWWIIGMYLSNRIDVFYTHSWLAGSVILIPSSHKKHW